MKLKQLLEQLQGVKKFNKMTWNDFESYLSQQGIKLIGSGFFGKVFSKDEWDFVYKVFEKDDPYLEFVNYTFNRPNKHLPVFLSAPKQIHQFLLRNTSNFNKMTVIKIEKLYKLDTNVSLFLRRNLVNLANAFKQNNNKPISIIEDNQTTHFNNINEILLKYKKIDLRGILELYNNLADLTNNNIKNDMHSGNFMQRSDGTIILVDAFSIYINLATDSPNLFRLLSNEDSNLQSGPKYN